MRKVFDIRWSNYVKSVTSTVSAVLLVAAAVLLKLSLGYTPGASTGLVFVLFVMAVFASNAKQYPFNKKGLFYQKHPL